MKKNSLAPKSKAGVEKQQNPAENSFKVTSTSQWADFNYYKTLIFGTMPRLSEKALKG